MQYGFVIDNRKCIGCHACTVACKSEHDVPVGVNRTWVKQVEKGVYPHTRRLFSVMRCNHCTEAPCVTICPTTALHHRSDGIVDFDNRRCIGCKGCMQACPYDALYIDPETHTAAKCNYCAHRVDIGLEPACVNVCPEHAIISGDLDDPGSEIAQLVSRETVVARKTEKGTRPNLFYIDGDQSVLDPAATERSDAYFWSGQTAGVGHFARYAEARSAHADPLDLASRIDPKSGGSLTDEPHRQIDVVLGKARRTYDSPDKGLLWGREVVAYVWTKAIAAGVVLAWFIAHLMPGGGVDGSTASYYALAAMPWIATGFLLLTLVLLVADLDKPARFAYVLLRPQWKSWLVRGGFILTAYGAVLAAMIVGFLLDLQILFEITFYPAVLLAALAAVYTAFLFAQGKGRDFWQSPALALHMLVHAVGAGASAFLVLQLFMPPEFFTPDLAILLAFAIGANLLVTAVELITPHATKEAQATARSITRGRYARLFWFVVVGAGNVIPFALVLAAGFDPGSVMLPIAGAAFLFGLWFTEKIWVEAPQRLPLS